METTLYRVEFTDGREFRVFCANRAQKKRFSDMMYRAKEKLVFTNFRITEISNGIHDIKQWEAMLPTLIK